VERQLPADNVLTVSYVGRTGLHMERVRDLNALRAGSLQAAGNPNPAFLRPYKGYAFIYMGENAARSEYNSLQIELNRRFASGFSYGFAYTLSKSEDNSSDRRAKMYNMFDDTSYWGPSNWDTRHVAVFNAIWELPFLRRDTSILGKVLGNWQLTGVAQFQTGTPFTIGRGEDIAGVGSTEFQPWDVQNISFQRKFSENNSDPNVYFTATSTPPPAGTFATTQTRNTFYGAGFQNWNLSAFKNFPITERHNIQFRAEAFNFINHPNLGGANGGNPNSDPRSGAFGRITTWGGERNIQLSLRYQF
jgi:hypothetical protein